jgi:class 3 adenylate cyclase/tetratricopeptide (TPR) repeat protein
MSCSACGTPLADGARFCHACGASVAVPECRSCGQPLLDGARFCSACGSSQAEPDPTPAHLPPAAARRVTSVLFGDLVGFTSLSETRDQEDVRELLSRYFEECSLIIGRYGGTVEKYIGDAVMAVWGVPTAHEDDAERAVRAGLELVNKVAAFGEELGVPDLAMRVGIVTGEVAVTIGADHQGMVAGDVVNTASRVQSAAEPGQVWVDETTRLLTTSAITFVDVGSHQLKGKADPVPLWSVRAVVSAMRGAQRADGLEAPLVGRERELRLFKELFHSAEETGKPVLFVVDGEPGVGKSRLAWEFEKYVDGLTMNVRWHSGRCVAYGEGVAFYALAEAIRGRLAAIDDDVDDDPAELLDTGLALYVPDEEERSWLRPRIGALLGIGSVGTFPREDLFSAWATFLERAGEGNPVVLVIDDAQHADDGLLSFVEHLLLAGAFPCFVVLLTRPGLLESHPALATNRRATVAHLPELAARDISELLGGLVAGLPDDIRAALVERSEGVPLFAVETVRSLIDRDLVVPRGGQYVLADPETLDLASIGAPASLQALIAARLDTLSVAQRRVVDQASVLGSPFKRDTLASLCADVPDIDDVLASLVRLQILKQEASRLSAEFGQYQFTQSVVPQVAYATLSRRDRKASHLAVIRRYEDDNDSGADLAPVLAQHYLEAIDAVPAAPDVRALTASAIGHLERAAARARSLGSPSEAAGHLKTALAHATDDANRARLDCELAGALGDAGSYAEAVVHAARATEWFDQHGDTVNAGRAAAAHATGLQFMGDNTGALAIAEPRWQALLGHDDATVALMALSRVITSIGTRLGTDNREVLEFRIRLAELVDDPGELADAITGLALTYGPTGASWLSRILLEAAVDLARSEHQPIALARALLNLTVSTKTSDLDKAIEVGREAVAVATGAGGLVWIWFSEINLLLALWDRGRWADVEELLDVQVSASARGIDIPDSAVVILAAIRASMDFARGVPPSLPWAAGSPPVSDDASDTAFVSFAEAVQARHRGDLASAVRLAAEAAETIYAISGTWDDCVHIWPTAVELALEHGDAETVARLVDLIDGQTNGPSSMGMRIHRKRVAGLLAIRDGGDPHTVETALREAIAEYDEWGATPYRARTQAELGAWLVTQGRGEEAAELLDAARAVFAELGAASWLETYGLDDLTERSAPAATAPTT